MFSDGRRVVCGWRFGLKVQRTFFRRSHELYVMEQLDPMCDEEIVRFSPTSKLMVGEQY